MQGKTNLKTSVIIAVFLVATACRIAAGDVIYVDDDASLGGNGQSWTTAYKYLQDALAAAASGDEIWVAQGIYNPDQGVGQTPGDRNATFQLINGVAIYGGFPPGGSYRADPDRYETTLSGDLAGNDIPVADPFDLLNDPCRADNSWNVVIGSATDKTAILDGFTVIGARGFGGMVNSPGSPTVTNCTFSSNEGSGMRNGWDSSPTVTNCTFTRNSNYMGGGMWNWGGGDCAPRLTNCTFQQ